MRGHRAAARRRTQLQCRQSRSIRQLRAVNGSWNGENVAKLVLCFALVNAAAGRLDDPACFAPASPGTLALAQPAFSDRGPPP